MTELFAWLDARVSPVIVAVARLVPAVRGEWCASEGRGWRVRELRHREAVGELERRLEQIGEPGGDVGAHHDAVDHHVDVVVELLVERRRRGDLVELAVDLDPLEARFMQLGEFLAVLALAAAHDRRKQVEPRALRQRHDAVDHLRDGLALDRQAGRRRIGDADARPQQAHVVVDLGDGADRRARVLQVVFCSIEIAGDSPSIWSTSGFCIISRNWRA